MKIMGTALKSWVDNLEKTGPEFKWGEKVKSNKTIGVNKHIGEVLIFCCLNPSIPKYAIVLDENSCLTELQVNYLEKV